MSCIYCNEHGRTICTCPAERLILTPDADVIDRLQQEIESLRKDNAAWVDVANIKQREIESLRRDKAHLEDTCNAEQERGDEWKRRATLEYHHLIQCPAEAVEYDNGWEEFCSHFQEAKEWFEQE